MPRLLRFLLIARFKQRQPHQGFTLIELLVAMIIAVLVMTPLMALAINLINTDRREQAKSTSEQELQSAADFIARDLERAIYVYDSVALTRNYNPTVPADSGIRDQIPPTKSAPGCSDATRCHPVLAFWTRRPVRKAVPVTTGVNCTLPANQNQCDDTFVYSLVVYYLILNNNVNNVWSNTARIGRFEISDGVKNNANEYIETTNPTHVLSGNRRDKGFVPFDLGLNDDIRLSMNLWRSGNKQPKTPLVDEAFTKQVQILLDYIDHTVITNPVDRPTPLCPAPVTSDPHTGWIQSPYYGTYQNPVPISNATPAQFQTYSFYSCINGAQGIAKIYLRGNALARIQGRNNPPQFSTSPNIQAFFPTISIEVNAEGAINQ